MQTMVYGNLNIFVKTDVTLSNEEKIKKLKQYDTGDLLTLLRNIEESSYEYEEEIIKAVFECLYDKGIMCI